MYISSLRTITWVTIGINKHPPQAHLMRYTSYKTLVNDACPRTNRLRAYATVSSSHAGPSKSKYPYPKSKNPTPHELFHLPHSSTPADIKARYFELVKIHHPDANSPCSQHLPASTRHERFQAITTAYNYLSRKPGSSSWPPNSSRESAFEGNSESFRDELQRRKTAFSQADAESPRHRVWRGKRNEWGGFQYDEEDPLRASGSRSSGATEKVFNPEDRMFWILGSLAVVGAVYHFFAFSPNIEAAKSHAAALQNLESARRGREEYGALRRQEAKKWVEQQQHIKAAEVDESGVFGLGKSSKLDKLQSADEGQRRE